MAATSGASHKGRSQARPVVKRDRINVRLDPALKELIERAADFSGLTLSQFVVTNARIAAEQTIRDHELLTLSVRDSHAVMESLHLTAKPGARLQQAAERYKGLIDEG